MPWTWGQSGAKTSNSQNGRDKGSGKKLQHQMVAKRLVTVPIKRGWKRTKQSEGETLAVRRSGVSFSVQHHAQKGLPEVQRGGAEIYVGGHSNSGSRQSEKCTSPAADSKYSEDGGKASGHGGGKNRSGNFFFGREGARNRPGQATQILEKPGETFDGKSVHVPDGLSGNGEEGDRQMGSGSESAQTAPVPIPGRGRWQEKSLQSIGGRPCGRGRSQIKMGAATRGTDGTTSEPHRCRGKREGYLGSAKSGGRIGTGSCSSGSARALFGPYYSDEETKSRSIFYWCEQTLRRMDSGRTGPESRGGDKGKSGNSSSKKLPKSLQQEKPQLPWR